MLIPVLGHGGAPLRPHDLLTAEAWPIDPLIVAGLGAAVIVYRLGDRPSAPDRSRLFFAGLAVIALALLSPLEPMSEALASAHMVQHVLLATVAPLLLVASRPSAALLRGAPRSVRAANRRVQQLASPSLRRRMRASSPALAVITMTAVLWVWHGRATYELAVRSTWVHVVQHATFFTAGLLLWSVVFRSARSRDLPPIVGVIVLFAIGLQTTFLAALMTFSPRPWYDVFATTTSPWGLDPLADQHLAGTLMWFPSGFLNLAAALWLLVGWMLRSPTEAPAIQPRVTTATVGTTGGNGIE